MAKFFAKNIIRGLVIIFFVGLLGVWALGVENAKAADLGVNTIKVYDTSADVAAAKAATEKAAADAKGWSLETFLQKTYKNVIAKVFGQVLSSSLNTLAVDSAKYIASGGNGQGTMFHQSSFGTYLKKVGDSVAGQFIESATKALVSDSPNSTIANFSFCNPGDLNVAITIGLGLRSYTGNTSLPSCTFSKIRKNVETFANDVRLMKVFQDMFQPTSNDLGLALTLQSKTTDLIITSASNAGLDRQENKGWLRVQNAIGDEGFMFTGYNLGFKDKLAKNDAEYNQLLKDRIKANNAGTEASNQVLDDAIKLCDGTGQCRSDWADIAMSQAETADINASARNQFKDIPGSAENINSQIWSNLNSRMLTTVGDALVDSANVFLNQLALNSFNNLMKKIGGTGSNNSSDFKYDDNFWKSLTDSNASSYNPGVSGAIAKAQQLKTAQFSVRADFDILSTLSICTNPQKAGPTDCVIDDKFRQAVQDRKTVGEAIKDGSLPGDRVFGFLSPSTEPKYNEGYPYRSMLILRKYRILPVGWEVAGQYIHDHFSTSSVNGPVTLQQLVDCFSPTDEYNSTNYNQEWCRDLVDPNWLLKAPKNYCGKLGVGPTIQSQNVGADGQLTVSRAGEYCADDQSCIKEKDDGSCEMYGYCAEDKRIWNFGSEAKSCEPINNTCRSFVNSETKETGSYLQNTLDYANCDASTVGCKAYCTTANPSTYSYDATTQKLSYKCGASSVAPERIFFDHDAKACADKDEGCHQFIRTKEGAGANLLINPSLEDGGSVLSASSSLVGGYATIGSSIDTTDGYDGSSSLVLKPSAPGTATATVPIGMQIFGWSFSFSFYSKGCTAQDTFAFNGYDTTVVPFATSTTGWSYNQASTNIDYYSTDDALRLLFNIQSPTCKIDALKLERGLTATGYSNYGSQALIYEKLLPKYLEDTHACEMASSTDLCKKYVQKCTKDEVGCDMFTSQTDGTQIPGRVKAGDYCSAECVGFNDYMQTESVFDERGWQFFIPRTAKACKAEEVGCDEFTNVDKVGAGGESVEYYSYLRQCVKPASTEAAGRCTPFYTWQSAGGQDFQLAVVNLFAKSTLDEPDTTSDDAQACNQQIYNLDPTDPKYNTNCRQYYDKNGKVTYHLVDKTISCNDDCHPYRLTRLNTSQAVNTQVSCEALVNKFGQRSAVWDAGKVKCQVCSNNGEMVNAAEPTAEHYCVYQAIPNQGVKCSAAANGCREFVGSRGENVAQLMFSDFEDPSLDSWQAISTTNIAQTASLRKNGHALRVTGGEYAVGKKIGNLLRPGKTYSLSFLAQNDDPGKLIQIYLNKSTAAYNAGTVINSFSSGLSVGAWQLYTLTFTASSTYEFTGDEALIFDGDSDFSLDEVKLKEITDRYNFIKESWNTPDSCYYNLEGNSPPPDINNLNLPYQLHCDAYKNSDGTNYYLRSFDTLCQESAVGCELMIDTHNSKSYQATGSFKQELSDDFNNNSLNGWVAPANSSVSLDSQAMKLEGERIVIKPLGFKPENGKHYVLTLRAKGSNYLGLRTIANPLNPDGSIKNLTDASIVPRIDQINVQNELTSDWLSYTFNFTASANYAYDGSEYLMLKITGSAATGWLTSASQPGYGPVYIDDIKLRDADSQGIWVPADNYAYVVYDKTKLCGASQKGCERMGQETIYNDTLLNGASYLDNSKIKHDDVYLLNDPDNYDKSLCGKNNLNCQAWKNDQSEVYFINPLDNVCEYRQKDGSTQIGWLKKKMKYCGGVATLASPLCTTNDDCANQTLAANKECKAETVDHECSVNGGGAAVKTFGQGSSQVQQPVKDVLGNNWAGVCADDQSGCTEYIDPVSKPSPNILFNPTLDNLDNDTNPATFADGWTLSSDGMKAMANVSLNPYTVYTLGFASVGYKDVTAQVTCSGGVNMLAGLTNKLTNDPITVNLKAGESTINFRTDNATACLLTLSTTGTPFQNAALNGEVVLRKTLVDYKLEKSLDKTSCNGEVDFGQGCVLFNERKIAEGQDSSGLKYASTTFDADINYGSTTKKATVGATPADNNSNAVIKVESDRKCNKWLTCSAKINYTDTGGTEKSYCSGLAMCDLLKPDGSCEHVTKVDTQKQDYVFGSGQKYLNYTSYSKVGQESSANVQMTGFYAIDKMDQVGDYLKVPNGDFEISSVRSFGDKSGRAARTVFKPASWEPADGKPWDSAFFEVVNDAVTAQKEGVRYPISGRGFLKIGADYAAKSDMIHLFSSTDGYKVTFMINTKNLSGGSAKVSVIDKNDLEAASSELAAGEDWTMKMLTIPGNTPSPVHLKISNLPVGGKNVGRFYLDNFQIKPVANITNVKGNQFYRAPECRLYPAQDSLACEYIEESGLKAKGLQGYCLEYDRAPGDPNTCLLWWPGDHIRGDGISEEGIGYQGPAPLYYCAEAQALTPVKLMRKEIRSTKSGVGIYNDSSAVNSCSPAPEGRLGNNYVCSVQETPNTGDSYKCWFDSYHKVTDYDLICKPKLKEIAPYTGADINYNAGQGAWYEYNGDFIKSETLYADTPASGGGGGCGDRAVDCNAASTTILIKEGDVKFVDESTGKMYDSRMAYCNKVVRTVTESGENKFWSGRVYPNSKYTVPGLNYTYNTSLYPFASMVAPDSFDPYNWDGDLDPGSGADPIIMYGFVNKEDRKSKVNTMPYLLNGTSSSISVGAGTPSKITITKTDCSSFDGAAGAAWRTDPLCKKIYCLGIPEYTGATITGCKDGSGNSIPTGPYFNTVQACYKDLDPKANIAPNPACLDASCACLVPVTNTYTLSVPTSKLSVSTTRKPNSNIGYCVDNGGVNGSFDACLVEHGTNDIPKQFQCDGAEHCISFPSIPGNNPFAVLGNLYAASYGVWAWNYTGADAGHYKVQTGNVNWSSPSGVCSGVQLLQSDPSYHWDCGIMPQLFNVSVNGKCNNTDPSISVSQSWQCPGSDLIIHKSGFANITFNSKVDIEQRPLTMFEIDWRNGQIDRAAGVQMTDRSSTSTPHTSSHLFDYWTLKASMAKYPTISCSDSDTRCSTLNPGPSCSIKPRVKIKDNWDYCNVSQNNPNDGTICDWYVPAAQDIVVCAQ